MRKRFWTVWALVALAPTVQASADAPEIGVNDFRISNVGVDGDPAFFGIEPSVTYNATTNEYLVVWWGNNNTGTLGETEIEIFGQRIDAATGAEVGPDDFRISDLGPDGLPVNAAHRPALAYNPANNEYLVVWWGSEPDFTSGDVEIFCQRLDGATGAEVGSNDVQISDTGPSDDPDFSAVMPAVAYNSIRNEYLVVWQVTGPTQHQFEIFGQRIDAATGAEVGPDDFRISQAGPDGNSDFDAFVPSLVHNPANNEYLVVWMGNDDDGPQAENEYEIFGQRLDGTTGAEIGLDDFRVSDMGPAGDPAFNATAPAVVAYNPADNEYLVVWVGDDTVQGEFEVFAQRLDAVTGAQVGPNDFRISNVGPPGDSGFGASHPSVTYDSARNEYLVVWLGDDAVDGEFEVFGQRLDASGIEIGPNDFRVSDMGRDGDPDFDAAWPDVAYSVASGEYLVVWYGDDDTGELVEGEWEVFGQRLVACPGDLDRDGVVGPADLEALVTAWGPNAEHPGNLDGDGHVGITDLFKLFFNWGPCP